MCEPATILGISTAVAGAAVSAIGSIQAGKAEAAQAQYQAQIARNNQILAERQAQDAVERGRIAETNQRIATKQLVGRQRAALAGSGVETDVGSALSLQQDTAGIGELDALTIRSNAEREAMGFRQQGMNFSAEAELSSSRSGVARAAGYAGAVGSALTGASSVASKWYDYKKFSVPSSPLSPKPGNSYLAGPI